MAVRATCGPVLVVDDDPLLRGLVSEVLAGAGYETVEAADGLEALNVGGGEPVAAVLDVDLPRVSGWEVCRVLRERHGPSLPVLFVSGVATEPYDRVAALLLGGDDFLAKPFEPDELLVRLRRLLLLRVVAPATPLTRRELEILRLLAEGVEPRAIAERLVISPRTVRTHVERILGKLGVHSRAQAVAVAYRTGLIAA